MRGRKPPPMDHDQHEAVRQAFSRQADGYARSYIANPEALGPIAAETGAGPDDLVLDVVTGTGFLALELAGRAGQVIGVDLTEEMLKQARRLQAERGLTRVRFQQAEAESLPFADGTFDLVTCRLAIHHFGDPRRPLREMARVCRRRGRVVVADIVASDDPEAAEAHNALERLRDPSHVRLCSARELEVLLREAGLEVLRSRRFSTRVQVESWLALTSPPATAAAEVRRRLEADLGLDRMGIEVGREVGPLAFTHRWLILVATADGL